MSEESKTLFFDDGIVVTSNEVIIYKHRMRLDEISGAQCISHYPSRRGPLFLSLIGLLFLVAEWRLGVVFFVLAALWFWRTKKIYSLELDTIDGRIRVLYNSNVKMMKELCEAINDRIR